MQNTLETWKIKKSEQIADCKVFTVRQNLSKSSEGKESNFYVLDNPDWVNVIALTESNEVVVIEQFRHGIEEITLEIPGGMVDGDEGAGEAAKRELVEETGYTPREIILLGKSLPNPAIQNNWVYHYLAIDCQKTHEPEFDSTENVQTKLVDLSYISKAIKNGEITHSLVIAAFYWFSLR